MTPRAVRPVRARKCAAGLSEARLAVRVTSATDAECIPISTSAAAGQTPRTGLRLPRSKLDILDAGHFTWEDVADQYAALVTTWWTGGYQAASS